MRIAHRKWFDAILFEIFKRQHELSEKNATNAAYATVLLAAVEKHGVYTSATPLEDPVVGVSYPFDQHKGVLYSLLRVTNKHRRNLSYPAVFQLQIIELYLKLI